MATENMVLENLAKLVLDIEDRMGSDFVGLGLVIYKNLEELPISPLKLPDGALGLPKDDYAAVRDLLLDISVLQHPYHDGFHLISSSFVLTHLSQYFSTPIIPKANIEYNFGSRYRTALYGSFLKSVIACGVLSKNHEPVIFVNGVKINPFEIIKSKI